MADIVIGRIFNSCKIEAKLAVSTTGKIYKAIDIRLQAPRAIKLIHKPLVQKDVVKKRFSLALQSWAKLDHPNFVHIFSAIDSKERLGFIMDFIEGTSLEALVEKNGHLGISQSIEYFFQIARALSFSHQKNTLHRKLSPSSILVTKEENIKISGLGAIRDLDHKRVTPKELCIGKAKYMAPEQFAGNYTEQTDLYALGAVFYEMLTGQAPFDGPTLTAICKKHLHKQVKKPRHYNPQISSELEQVIMKSLAKSPEDRFSDIKTFINEVALVTDRLDFSSDLSVQSLMSHGRKALEQRKLENAIFFFNKVLATYGKNIQNYKEAQKKREEAVKSLREEQVVRHARDWYQEALDHFDEEEEDKAKDYVIKVLRMIKKHPESTRLLGTRQDLLREMPELVEEAEAFIEDELKKGQQYTQRAEKALEINEYEETIDLSEEALRIDENNRKAQNLKTIAQKKIKITKITKYYRDGLVSLKNSEHMAAIKYFEKVLELHPEHKRVEKYLKVAQRENEKQITRRKEIEKAYKEALHSYENWEYERALEKFNRVIALDVDHKGSRHFINEVEKRINEEDKISDISFFFQKGTNFYKDGQWREAIVCFNRVLDCMENHKKALEYRNYAQQELERQELFERVMEEGMLLFDQNAYHDALERFDYLVKLDANNKEALKYQSLCQEFTGMH